MFIPRWQISAGEASEWLAPALFALAVVVSAWVLYDARRRRRFSFYAVAAWTLATLAAPHIALPLYLCTRLFKRTAGEMATAVTANASHAQLEEPSTGNDFNAPTQVSAEAIDPPHDLLTDAPPHKSLTGSLTHQPTPQPADPLLDSPLDSPTDTLTPPVIFSPAESLTADLLTDADATAQITDAPPTVALSIVPWRERLRASLHSMFAPPIIYALALLVPGAIYYYRDYQSFDAHLARAAHAQLIGPRSDTIRIYRAALRLSDDAHTHKLLALELDADHQPEAALAELRAAETGGEPDALLPLRIAHTLDALNRQAEAVPAYQRFLDGDSCTRPQPDPRCAQASARARQLQGEPPPP